MALMQSIPGQYNPVTQNYNAVNPAPIGVNKSVPGQFNPVTNNYNVSGGNGQVLPAQTSNTGGGGGGSPQITPQNYLQYGVDINAPQYAYLRDQMNSANNGMSQADIAATTAEYDALHAQIEGQAPRIQSTYQTGLTDVNNQIDAANNAAGLQKSDLNRTSDLATNQAYQNYLTSQRMNREAARASGSGTSSAYLDMQGNTNNSYGQTQANIGMDLTSRLQSIDQNISNVQSQGINAKQKLASDYNQAMSQIALDENATDAQKVAAIGKIRAQATQIGSQIDMQLAQMQQNLQIAKAQIAAYGGNINNASSGFTVPSLATNTPSTNYGPGQNTGSTFSGLNYDPTKQQQLY